MNEKFNFELSILDLNVILKGLKELPYKESNGLIQFIIDSYEKQAKEKDLANKKKEKANTKSEA